MVEQRIKYNPTITHYVAKDHIAMHTLLLAKSHSWFLKIAFVCKVGMCDCVCVFVCVCVCLCTYRLLRVLTIGGAIIIKVQCIHGHVRIEGEFTITSVPSFSVQHLMNNGHIHFRDIINQLFVICHNWRTNRYVFFVLCVCLVIILNVNRNYNNVWKRLKCG